jgi:putative ABC transport system substrate-binding protein
LAGLGYVEGQNLTIEWRYGAQNQDRMAELASELVNLGVDVLFTPGLLAIQAAKQATTKVPIVGISNDPVAMGLVWSLSRPGATSRASPRS